MTTTTAATPMEILQAIPPAGARPYIEYLPT